MLPLDHSGGLNADPVDRKSVDASLWNVPWPVANWRTLRWLGISYPRVAQCLREIPYLYYPRFTFLKPRKAHLIRPGNLISRKHILCMEILGIDRLYNIHILNLCPIQSRVEGRDAMKPLYPVIIKDDGRPRLTHYHRGRIK